MALDVEALDLSLVAAALQRAFAGAPPSGYVCGRTSIRDALATHLGCSQAEAERLVDTMVGRGFLRFEGDPSKVEGNDAPWKIVL